jgi:hypothetical protein
VEGGEWIVRVERVGIGEWRESSGDRSRTVSGDGKYERERGERGEDREIVAP